MGMCLIASIFWLLTPAGLAVALKVATSSWPRPVE
jgi:hypothetical protein